MFWIYFIFVLCVLCYGCEFMGIESRYFCIKCSLFMLILVILICDEIFVFNREK